MMTFLFLLITLYITDPSLQKPDGDLKQDKLQSFHWLDGTWQNIRTGDFEEWHFDTKNWQWKGRGLRVAEGDTTITEKLAISCGDEACYYIADVPNNPEPVRFRVTEVTASSFKSENPEHNFPKFINYELASPGRINASIGAGERTIMFGFQKTE